VSVVEGLKDWGNWSERIARDSTRQIVHALVLVIEIEMSCAVGGVRGILSIGGGYPPVNRNNVIEAEDRYRNMNVEDRVGRHKDMLVRQMKGINLQNVGDRITVAVYRGSPREAHRVPGVGANYCRIIIHWHQAAEGPRSKVGGVAVV